MVSEEWSQEPEVREPLAASSASPHELRLTTRLRDLVFDRFTRLTSLEAIPVPVSLAADDSELPPKPRHPVCADIEDSEYCERSWKAHLIKLRTRPEVNWHRCKHGRFCALVPLVHNKRCLMACQLVCPTTMSSEEFEHKVELLDVLVENFVAAEPELVAGMAVQQAAGPSAGTPALTLPDPDLSACHPLVAAALRYIKQHLTDLDLTVANIARSLDVNSTYLAHLFSQQVGMRMSRFISTNRIELARELLATTDRQIKQVAFQSGHSNPDWFSEVFRTFIGITPSQYRRQVRSNGPG